MKKKIKKVESMRFLLVMFSIFVLMFSNARSVYADTHTSSSSIEPQYALPLTPVAYIITVNNIEGDPIDNVEIKIPTGAGFSNLVCGLPPQGWGLDYSSTIKCIYTTSGNYIYEGESQEFTLTVTTPEEDGLYTWQVKTTDTGITPYTFTTNPTSYVDALGPEFTIVEPEDGTWVGFLVEFNVETSDILEEGSGITATECDVTYIDSEEEEYDLGTISYDGEICSGSVGPIPIIAAQGLGTLKVEIEDNIGNLGEASISLGFDTISPELDYAITTSITTIDVYFSEALDGQTVNASDFTVEDNTVIEPITVEDNVVTLTLGTEIGTADTPEVTIINELTDLAGNPIVNLPVSTIALDGIAPMMDFAITGDSLEGDSSQTRMILVQFSEDLDGRTVSGSDFSVIDHIIDRAMEVEPGIVTILLVDTLETDETPEIEIIGDGVADLNGNYQTTGVITPNDGLIPTMDLARLTTLTSIDVYFSENILVSSVQITDFTVEDNTVIEPITVNGNIVTLTLQNEANIGDNVWLVSDVDDLFGNTLTEAGPIPTIDGVPPEVVSLIINPESPVTTGIVEFSITFNENMDPSIPLTVAFGLDSPYNEHEVVGGWDPTDITIWMGTFNITPETGDGLNTISISDGEDLAGNVMEVNIEYQFEIDTMAPEFISITSPDPNNVYMNGEIITIIADLGETELDVVGDFSGIGIGLVDAVDNGDGTYTLTAVAGGIENLDAIEITATDLAGNSAIDDSFELIVDNTPPVIENITGNVNAQAGESVEIYTTITDSLSGVDNVILHYTPIGEEEETVNMINTVGDEWYVNLDLEPDMGEIPYYVVASDLGPNSVTSNTYTITVGAGPVSLSQSTVVADPIEMLEANGEDYSTVIVTVTDQFGNPKEGETVYLESDREEDIIEPDTYITGEDGTAIFTVSSTEGGTSTITTYVNGEALEQTVTITFEDLILDFPSEWTVFSVPTYLTVEQISELLPGEIDQVLMYDPINGYTTPTMIEPLVGYYIHNSGEETISVAFDYMTFSGGPTPLERFLNAGWNIMGVTPLAGEDEILANLALAELLSSQAITRLSNPYTGITYWATGYPPQFPEDLTLYLGEGHWIYTIEDGTLAGVFY